MYKRFAVLCLVLFSLGFVSALPSPNIVVRQAPSTSVTIPAALASPTSVTTTNIIQTANGNMTQTCVVTFTPVGQQIQEVQNCTTSTGTTVSSAILPSGTAIAVNTASTPSSSPSPIVAAAAAFTMPGTSIQVLPIGLGVYGGITAIAVFFVAFVTWERVQYRKAFRQQRMAETTMGYGAVGRYFSK